MGYRFTLESANTVANLTFGKVMACYRDIFSSHESFEAFNYFLKQFEKNMYSSDLDYYMESIRDIRNIINNYRLHIYHPETLSNDINEKIIYHNDLLKALQHLSDIFNRCKIKSLLLPPIRKHYDHSHEFIVDPFMLHELSRIHNGDSCLILQPQESPSSITIFNTFPNFDIALRQADSWPAVFFWEDIDNYVFVPVDHAEELLSFYQILKYNRHPLAELRFIANEKKKSNHYIFQLSDLHFGSSNTGIRKQRLESIISNQLTKIDINDSVDFIITGDAVDSPKYATEIVYKDFARFIEKECGQPPIRILGNHDINYRGLALNHRNQILVKSISEYPKIKILDDLNIILLLFNSNTNGNLAEGEIGSDQMSQMGNLLDQIDNLEKYSLIAVLHHHVLDIETPDFYSRKWFEKIIPESIMEDTLKLLDADLFIEWLHQRKVKVVLHGHKHIPFINRSDEGITIISCGSSTGQIIHKDRSKTYLSYNLLKITKDSITCTQFAEDIIGAGVKNIRTEIIDI